MSNKRGRLFVISASSGTGKTTLAHELLRRDKNLIASVSYTTRPPRPNERNGRDYYFVTKRGFLSKRRKGHFLEWANVFGKYYGTPKKEVDHELARGRNVLLLIDVQGAKKVKKVRPDAVFIFLSPPSREELKRRLKKRGTESMKEINRRYQVANSEMKQLNDMTLCDYRIVNKKISVARGVLKGIINAERFYG